MNSGTNEKGQKKVMHALKTIMEQNYFQFVQKYYKEIN
jgi:hypothetical protein